MHTGSLPSVSIEELNLFSCSALLAFDIKGTILQVNEAFLSWTGLSRDHLLKKSFPSFLNKGGVLYYQLFIQPILEMHKEINEISLEIKGDQDSVPCLMSAKVSETPAGTVVYATLFRVADRKRYEDELRKNKAVAEEQNQKKDKALEEIAFQQAHLVRAPLANILALAAMLENMDLNEEMKGIVTMLSQSAEHLDIQVNETLKKTV